MKIIILFFCILICFFSFSQELSEDPAIYKVTKYLSDNVNYSFQANEGDMVLYFYECEAGFCFENLWRKRETFSRGEVTDLKVTEFVGNEDYHPHVKFEFLWRFFNSYDDVYGNARVVFTLIKIRDVTKFTCSMVVLETNSILEFEGYKE